MKYSIIEDIEEFRRIAKEWDQVLLASGEDNPFLLSDFLLTWWKHYYDCYSKLCIIVLYEDGSVVGGLPLCMDRRGRLEYPGRIAANYTELLWLKDEEQPWSIIFKALIEIKGWNSLELKRFRKSNLSVGRLRTSALSATDLLVDIHTADPAYLITVPIDFSRYILNLPKKLRYYVRRSQKEFEKLGEISLRAVSDRREIGELCEKSISLSRGSFRHRKKESAFEDETYCLFFKELMMKLHDGGYLDANVLMLNEIVIAAHFGYSIRNNLNYIFPVFNIEYASLNPGHLLIYKLVELASRRKDEFVDLYTGRHLYKEQWSDREEEVISVVIRPDSLITRLERRLDTMIRTSKVVRKAKETVKRSRALTKAAQTVKKLTG